MNQPVDATPRTPITHGTELHVDEGQPGDRSALPLSAAQCRIWSLNELETDGAGDHWRHLAAQLTDVPDLAPMLVPEFTERDRQIIANANKTARPYTLEPTADELFAAQAARTPYRAAVRCGDREWTYSQLDARVSALAGLLRAAGGTGSRIGILMNRSAGMVAAVLATMRAGATFVPLAPDLPPERLAQLITSCDVRAVWTSPDTANLVPPGIQCLDVNQPVPSSPSSTHRSPRARPEVAYILHTSGSTGVPKGVEVPHSALTNLLISMAERPGLGAEDVLVSITMLTFDISLLEALLPLLAGAVAVVATDGEARDPARLAALLERHEATIVQATPSTWRMLLDSGWRGRARLRAWCGGEPLSRDLADRLLVRCAEVWNLYGPTETTIWSARWQVQPGSGPVLLGEPVANTTLHVLDQYRNPVPPGVPGELYIAGRALRWVISTNLP